MKERKALSAESLMDTQVTSGKAEKSEPRLGREIQTRIGHQLRALYDDVVSQGVPDRFVDLLRQLDQDSDKGQAE